MAPISQCSTSSSINVTSVDSKNWMIWARAVNNTMINCSFINCSSSLRNGDPVLGFIYLDTSNVINCSFINCFSSGDMLYVEAENKTPVGSNVLNCRFINCSSSSNMMNGDLIFTIQGDVENCKFINCSIADAAVRAGEHPPLKTVYLQIVILMKKSFT